ncbi:MAG: hypothetical protein ACXAEN_19285 [Candidatus Thorarchaeota archaeon]|jgi:hypothetical protein
MMNERGYIKDEKAENLLADAVAIVLYHLITLLRFTPDDPPAREVILGEAEGYVELMEELIEHDPTTAHLAMTISETVATIVGQYTQAMALKLAIEKSIEQSKDIPDDIADIFSVN